MKPRKQTNQRKQVRPGVWQRLRPVLGRLLSPTRLRRLSRRQLAVGCVALGGLFVATSGFSASLRDHPYFSVESIEYSGHGRLTLAELHHWVGVPENTSILDIDLGALERRLERHPWIRRADVEVHLPRRITVRLHERTPFAIASMGDFRHVDERGQLLAPLSPEDTRDLPIITGLAGAHGRASSQVALPRIAFLLRRLQSSGTFGEISEVHVDPEYGVTLFPVDLRLALVLGWDEWPEKLANAKRVLDTWRGREAKLSAIDLTLPGSVIVRLKGSGKAEKVDRLTGRLQV